MTLPPFVFIDTMLGFRLTSGTVVISLALVRSDFGLGSSKPGNQIQPTIDLAMPIPVLETILATMMEELAKSKVRAQLTPHETTQ